MYLEEQKVELANKKLLNNTDTLATRKMEREIDQADQEVRFVFNNYYLTGFFLQLQCFMVGVVTFDL